MAEVKFWQGNEAVAFGAIAAGCRFYAGYPLTPSTEIMETMAAELPKIGGVFQQMEDELGSCGCAIGASCTGVKAMTASSGPGFTLKQENIGLAYEAEIPLVVVDVMRGGPSTGLPTQGAQQDVMMPKWATHGDHGTIICANCGGTGREQCIDCSGTGRVWSYNLNTTVECSMCHGSGYRASCPVCHGTGQRYY